MSAIGTAAATSAVQTGINYLGSIGQNAISQRNYKKNLALANDYQKAAEKRQFQYNKELSDYVYQQNLDQWQRENDYNSPANQMARYKSAGLNANLIYGQQNLAGASPEASIGSVSTSAPSADAIPLNPVSADLSGINQAQQFDANYNLQSKIADAEVRNKDADTLGKLINNDIQGEAKDDIVEGIRLANKKTLQDIDKSAAEIEDINAGIEKKKAETAQIHQMMIKTGYETRITKARADIEDLLYRKEKANSAYYEQNAKADSDILKYLAKLRKKEYDKMKIEVSHWDEQMTTSIAYQAAQTLGVTANTSAQELETRINKILTDPDFQTDEYWSALALQALHNLSKSASFSDIVRLINGFDEKVGGKSSSKPVGFKP